MSQTLTAAGTSEKCLVSNQSATDVIVLKASLKAAASPADSLYDLPLTELPAGDSGPLLKAGAQAPVTVPDLSDGELYSQIVAKAGNLFPLKVETFTHGEQNQALTATDGDLRDMQQAEQFLACVTALPSSKLAKDYSAALSGKDPAKADSFFQGTEAYKQVTLEKVLAVQTYHHTYPYVWARYGNSMTYELHSSAGTSDTLIGSLQIDCHAPYPAGIDKSNPDFTLVYKPAAQGDDVPLEYAAGTFHTPDQRISLRGLFMVKSQFTGKDADNEIIGVLRGTVNGNEVLGYPRQTGSDEPWISVDGLLHPDDLKDWLEISAIIGTLSVVLLGLTAIVAKVVYSVFWSKKNPTRPVPDYVDSDTEDEQANEWAEEINRETDLLENKIQLKHLKETRSILLEQQKYLGKLAQIENTTELQDSADYLSDALDSIDKDIITAKQQLDAKASRDEDVQKRLPDTLAELDQNMQHMRLASERMKSKMNKTQKEQIEESGKAIDTLTESISKIEERRQRYEDGYMEEEFKLKLWAEEG